MKRIKDFKIWALVGSTNEIMFHLLFETRKKARWRSKIWHSDGGEKLKIIRVKIISVK